MDTKNMKKIALILSVFYPIVGCGEQTYTKNDSSIPHEIPNNYATLSHKDLVTKLQPSILCEGIDFDMSRLRFLTQIKLDDAEFLATVCEPGAYQDHYITYSISSKNGKTYARSLGWLEPVFKDNQWKLAPTYIMAGVIKFNGKSEKLVNFRQYSAPWTCGFNAYYSLPLKDSAFIKPDRVEADNDCDNGIRYDGWPEIDVSKMEVLDNPIYK